jgi:hypothetical protein
VLGRLPADPNIVVVDGAFTFDQRDLNGKLWTAEDVHALSLSNLAADYASIRATEEVIASAHAGGHS